MVLVDLIKVMRQLIRWGELFATILAVFAKTNMFAKTKLACPGK
jgi:hypothetical protein